MKGSSLIRLVVVASLAVLPGIAGAQNIVTNGGFETGHLTGWNASGCDPGAVFSPLAPPEGKYILGTSCTRANPTTLQQSLATIVGQSYTVSFFGGCDNCVGDEIGVDFGGVTYFASSLAGLTTYTTADGISWGDFSFTTGPATGTSTSLVFRLGNDPDSEYLDGVSVTANADTDATPEPASLVLIATGLVGVAGIARRKRAA